MKLTRIGIIGTGVSALCCFTPLLVILLGALGFSTVVGYLDLILLPMLAAFLVLTGYAFWRKR